MEEYYLQALVYLQSLSFGVLLAIALMIGFKSGK